MNNTLIISCNEKTYCNHYNTAKAHINAMVSAASKF